MTARELAIARSVIYAGLFDYPLTLGQLHYALLESDAPPSEILATYANSPRLHRIVTYRDGYFLPAGRDELIAERRHREARSRVFLSRYRWVLRLICAVPFTRMVALSGSIAHLNLERGGDLDLCIVTRGPHVWTVAVTILVLTKLLRRRRAVCANFVVSDAQLRLDQRDVFTANQLIHLKPIIGGDVLDEFTAANPFVARLYPNARPAQTVAPLVFPQRGGLATVKRGLEAVLGSPAPMIEAVCRRLYGWHLRRGANAWRSPDQVRLGHEMLKLHTRSHREVVQERFERAVDEAWAAANRVEPLAVLRA